MRRISSIIGALIALSTTVLLSGIGVTPLTAASLTNVSVTLGTTALSTATSFVINYTLVTTVTNNTTFAVTYDTGFTGGAAIVSADVVLTGSGASAITTNVTGATAGYFLLTLTAITGTPSTITITLNGTHKLTTPAASGNYNVSVTENIGGAGTTYDYGAGLAYVSNAAILRNQVQITAVVPPVIALDLYQVGTSTKLVDPNTCALGPLSINAINTCTYDVGVGTNDTAGTTIKVVAGGGLLNGAHTFVNASGAITAGTEAYGFAITTNGSVFTPSGSYATLYQTVPTGAAATFATSAAVSANSTITDHFRVTHAATMSTSTTIGTNYTQTLTYTAFTN